MTKEEAKALLEKFGVKVGEITDDIAAEVAEWKAGLDTETRRTVRVLDHHCRDCLRARLRRGELALLRTSSDAADGRPRFLLLEPWSGQVNHGARVARRSGMGLCFCGSYIAVGLVAGDLCGD